LSPLLLILAFCIPTALACFFMAARKVEAGRPIDAQDDAAIGLAAAAFAFVGVLGAWGQG
jgi:hypothetical protein